MALYNVTFAVSQKEDLREVFSFVDDAKAAINLTGASFKLTFRNGGTEHVCTLGNGGVVVSEPATGVFEVVVAQATLAGLPAGDYEHDLIVTLGGVKREVWRGTLTLTTGV